MRIEWNRNQLYILIGTIIVLLVSLFLLYRFWIAPERTELEGLEEQIITETERLQALESQREDEGEPITLATSRELQSRLPVLKAPDQMLLALERAESASNSFIESIAISSAEGLSEDEESTPDFDLEGETGEGEVPEVDENLPAGVSSITFDMSVASQDFVDLMAFLREVTNSSRIVSIDSVSFNDDRIIEGDLTYFFYFVTLSAYYYPGLNELVDEMPEYHYDSESNKQNPFPYGDGETNLESDESTEEEAPVQEESSPQESIAATYSEHVVGEDETLYRIIYEFYGRYNETLAEQVRQANNKSSDTVFEGETILLPL
ncbi:hypothetical protein LCM20_04970 [Halobacillus litoralis]|uniref:LysM peptidoglycan-binding domain-containing protein n=1 Tax=Halobacillus litoralis TaxID=45668 RepID=UPI001CD3E617|nr:LysM peptidoglycan-binding domain-containing protein [Halobacillus litoralis]MCA0969931.1 hypothetical protein [Halobacillus litoralis]